MDEQGRVTVPKEVREKLGIDGPSIVEVEVRHE